MAPGFITRKLKKLIILAWDAIGQPLLVYCRAGAALGAAGLAASGTASAATSASIGAIKGALSTAIVNGVTNGEIDPEQILQSAVTGGITSAVSDFLTGLVPDDVVQSLSTGSEAVDNILSSMVKDVVRQGVLNGDIDINQVITSGLLTTAEEFIDWFEGQSAISEEQQAEWEEYQANQTAEIQEEIAENLDRTFGNSINEAIANSKQPL